MSKKSQLISLLNNEGEAIEKNQLLASVLFVDSDQEYTPLNIRAPFNGILADVYYEVGDSIPPSKDILRIKNFKFLKLQCILNSPQFKYVRKNQEAIIFTNEYEDTLDGFVDHLNVSAREVHLLVPEPDSKYFKPLRASGWIHCGNVRGDFIRKEHFASGNTVTIQTEENISVEISKVGESDSLCMIYPALPDQQTVWIKKEKS